MQKQANLKVLIKELQTQCKTQGTMPDQLLKLVATIDQACRQLCEDSLRCMQSIGRIGYSNYGLFLMIKYRWEVVGQFKCLRKIHRRP